MAGTPIEIGHERSCTCPTNHLNCLEPKAWARAQIGVWRFYYEGRDVRDSSLHPAVFPLALARQVIELFSHRGELILDPFAGSGTTLLAARDCARNAVGFDLKADYVTLANSRLSREDGDGADTRQFEMRADAASIPEYLSPGTVGALFTSPPYSNLLNRSRGNKSRRSSRRLDPVLAGVPQYSQDPDDLGTMAVDTYLRKLAEVFSGLLPLLRPGGHCVVNVPDPWWNGKRHLLHSQIVEALVSVGYEFRNTIIWDRSNLVNRIGIFGWPSNYITMGTTFEYLLDFRRPPLAANIQSQASAGTRLAVR